MITDDLALTTQAANHAGNCRCWICLHWWATVSKPYYRESLSPFPESAVESYLTQGFTALVYDSHFSALVRVRGGTTTTDSPTLQTAMAILNSDSFADLKAYAQAQGWTVEHPYAEVRHAHLD